MLKTKGLAAEFNCYNTSTSCLTRRTVAGDVTIARTPIHLSGRISLRKHNNASPWLRRWPMSESTRRLFNAGISSAVCPLNFLPFAPFNVALGSDNKWARDKDLLRLPQFGAGKHLSIELSEQLFTKLQTENILGSRNVPNAMGFHTSYVEVSIAPVLLLDRD